MDRWRRVGKTPAHVVGTFAFGAVGAAATLGLLYVLIAGSGDVFSWLGAELFVAALTALAFRYGLIGVFVNADGVRNRSMWQTQTIPWPDILRFETRPVDKGAHAVWILLKGHSALRTSVVFQESGKLRTARLTVPVVPEQTAQQALRDLRAAHDKAR
jgi:hypothetical protein